MRYTDAMFARSATRLQRQAILPTGTGYTSRQSLAMVPTIMCGQMKKVGLADQRTSNGLPSASAPAQGEGARNVSLRRAVRLG